MREHGSHVLKVFGDEEWPPFTYTIGLYENFRHPELIIVGMSGHLAHPLLNDVRDLIRGGRQFSAGDFSDEVLERFPVTFRAVSDENRLAHFGWATWFYGGEAYPALQLVLPDLQGRWPWDPTASDNARRIQPLLDTTPLPGWARNTS